MILALVLLFLAGAVGLEGFNFPGLPGSGDGPVLEFPDLPVLTLIVPTIDLNLPTLEAGAATLLPGLATGTPAPPGSPSPDEQVAACIPTGRAVEDGTVTRVVDGDTIEVDIRGREYDVRYIGIDTPESTRQVEYFGPEASEKNRQLVEGQAVRLVKDVSETDRFGRLLRYVFVGDTFINYELVVQGYAAALTYPPDVACAETFQAAEGRAREAGLGLWAAATAAP